MKTNKLFKVYVFLFTIFFAAGLYLVLNMVFGLNSARADQTTGKFWPDKPWALGGDCRRDGNSCSSKAEFRDYSSANVPEGQMLYCDGNLGTSNGLIYGNWQVKSIGNCYSQSSLCSGRSGFISNGDGATCGNPYKCPPAPTPSPSPAPQAGSIRVNTVCTDGPVPSGARVDLTVHVVRASDGVGLARESRTLNIGSGMTVSVFDRNYFPVKANLDAQNITNGLRVSRNGCAGQNLNNGGSCTLEFTGCRTSTPPPSPSPSPSPTPSVVRRCEGLTYADGSKDKTVGVNDTIDMVARTSNPSGVWGKVVPFNLDNNGVAAKIPVTTSPAGYSRMEQDAPDGNPNAVRFQLTGNSTSGNVGSYTFKVKVNQLLQTDANNGQVLKNIKLHSYAGHYPLENDGACEVTLHIAQVTNTPTPTPSLTPSPSPTPTRTPGTPRITIQKTLTSPNFQPVGGQVNFNIVVTNTGDVDIRSFVLTDDFDPSYLSLDLNKNGSINDDLDAGAISYKGQPLKPNSIGTAAGNRTLLVWNDMPPKSTVIANEDGVLTVGESMTLNLKFVSLKATTTELTTENDNCGVVNTITYRDTNGQDTVVTVNQKSCAEFNVPEQPSTLVVDITKSTLTERVNVGQDVRFQAVIKNTSDRPYTDIDFIDQYDAAILQVKSVKVTGPNGKVVELTTFTSLNPLTINNLQSIDGNLAPGKTYTLEIVFTARAPLDSTCDTVITNVTDQGGNGASDQAKACAGVNAPPPPKTGANFILNFVAPSIVLMGATAGRAYLRFKMVA